MRARIPVSVLFAFGVAASASAVDTSLRGQVRINELQGPPMPGVQIKGHVDGAGPVASRDPFGEFSLAFPGCVPGELVRLTIIPPDGYEYVGGRFATELRLPNQPRDADAIHTILVCKKGEAAQWLQKWITAAVQASVDAAYAMARGQLIGDSPESTQSLADLDTRRNRVLSVADQLVTLAAWGAGDEADPLVAVTVAAFLQGRADEAMAMLDRAALEQQAASSPELPDAVLRLRAQLLACRLDLTGATIVAEDAVRSEPSAPENHVTYGTLLAAQGRDHNAISAYSAGVACATSPGQSVALGVALQGLGRSQGRLRQFDEATIAYRGASEVWKPLARDYPLQFGGNLVNSKLGAARSGIEWFVQLPEPDSADRVPVLEQAERQINDAAAALKRLPPDLVERDTLMEEVATALKEYESAVQLAAPPEG